MSAFTPLSAAAARKADTQPDTIQLVVTVADDSSTADFLRGIEIGALEAGLAARMLGMELRVLTDTTGLTLDQLGGKRITAVIAFHQAEEFALLARRVASAGIPMLNARSDADSLRRALCAATLFHVAPSSAMIRDARRMVANEVIADSLTVVTWHGSLERFGAGELNDRYRSRYGADATEGSWLGWVSVKILVEAALRSGSSRAADVVAHLRSGSHRFDGHKGKPLSFRPWDGQLRQPVYYLTQNGDGRTRAVELPLEDRADGSSAADQLDTLGDGPMDTRCRRP